MVALAPAVHPSGAAWVTLPPSVVTPARRPHVTTSAVTGLVGSSFVIVPTASARVNTAPSAPLNVTPNVSSISVARSPTIGTRMVAVVAPGANVTVPVTPR